MIGKPTAVPPAPGTEKLLPFIMGVYVGTLIISNVLSCKIVDLKVLELTAGTILFPVTYVVGDILTEVYGYRRARAVIWTGTGLLVLMILMTLLVQALPGGSGWSTPDQAAFNRILAPVMRINIASICSVFAGEFLNSYVLARMKVADAGRRMGLRFVLSTMAGQACDALLFMGISFAGLFPWSTLLALMASNWAFKVAWETLALPLTLAVVRFVKAREGMDVFDRKTNFNPLRLELEKIGTGD